jgi:hypothetical protein
MKIMVLTAGERVPSPEERAQQLKARREYLMQFASPGTEIEVFATKGIKTIMRGRDIALVVPSAVETAIQGEKDGFDAIIIHAI